MVTSSGKIDGLERELLVVITGGSLFSGIGGMDLAASIAGIDIRFQVEIDDYCRKVLAKHAPVYWSNAKQFTDVCGVSGHELGYVDILFGGFPCQDISHAGKGTGLEGERSGLWWEFYRLIGEIRPRAIVLENVAAITFDRRGGTEVIAALAGLGYSARWGVISAADAGAPHERKRWFCVGYRNGSRLSESPAADIGQVAHHIDSDTLHPRPVGCVQAEAHPLEKSNACNYIGAI
jgi:DNA (cytosine-5)-methyltransferase 1